MKSHLWWSPLILGGGLCTAIACSGDEPSDEVIDPSCRAQGRSAGDRFEDGDPKGHPAPEGARAAKQARAGRIDSAAQIRVPKNPRARIKLGDYMLANDKVALYIGNELLSDGMSMFGGEILAFEPVGEDGLPRGESNYGETLVALSRQVIAPERVSVLKDGADGGEAIIRAQGVLQNVAFMDPFRVLFPHEYDFPAAIDYVLKPGADTVTLRLHLMNFRNEEVDFSGREHMGFFHYYTSQLFTPDRGFAEPRSTSPWVAFDSAASSAVAAPDPSALTAFAVRMKSSSMNFGASISGFQYFIGSGLKVEACGEISTDYVEITVSDRGIDGLREKLGETSTQESRGVVRHADGSPAARAWVFAEHDEKLYSRTLTDDEGRYQIHAPSGSTLVAYQEGHARGEPTATAAQVDLSLPAPGALAFRVTGSDTDGGGLPVRIQVIPELAEDERPAYWLPARYGITQQQQSALPPRYALQGEARISAPPGRYRVVISRGYEYELFEQTYEVTANETVGQDIELARSVDSTGVMCADFHIHSNLSFDSNDPVRVKVASAIADGLEIPVSSEHEWILDFMPTVRDLGMAAWAYSFPSEELTTFNNGHFGVVPIFPRPELRNNGAVHWIGRRLGQIFEEVHQLPYKPVVIVNHPTGGVGGYLSTVDYDHTTGQGSGDEWTENYDALEVFNDDSFDTARSGPVRDWFGMLNHGKRIFAVGASDSHHILTSPIGYPRTCMVFGHDDPSQLSAEIVRDVLRTGGSTIRGGISLDVHGPGGELPMQNVPGGGEFEIVVQAPSFIGVKELEVIVDGEVTQTLALEGSEGEGPGLRFTRSVNVARPSGDRPHWVLFHVRGDGDLAPLHPGRVPFAVSNPFWL